MRQSCAVVFVLVICSVYFKYTVKRFAPFQDKMKKNLMIEFYEVSQSYLIVIINKNENIVQFVLKKLFRKSIFFFNHLNYTWDANFCYLQVIHYYSTY